MPNMMKRLTDSIKLLFLNLFSFEKKTFTFYIPAPPERSTGYREREFDQILHNYLNKGHRLLDIKCQPHGEAGIWVICTVQPTKTETRKFLSDFSCSDLESDKTIELDKDFTVVHD